MLPYTKVASAYEDMLVAFFSTHQFGALTSLVLQGFNPAEVPSAYGDTLTFWDWRERKVTQSVKLGADGLIPLARSLSHILPVT